MSHLTVYLETDSRRPELATAEPDLIAAHLGHAGILFERWRAERPLPARADTDTVLAAYAEPVARLQTARGFLSVDVARVTADTPDAATLRAKFLDEHTHSEDEARFFVEGSGTFFIHTGRRVFRLLCEAGDLLSVPAGAPHWFDMGARPHFTAIRFFTRPDGWVAAFTGDTIADRFRLP